MSRPMRFRGRATRQSLLVVVCALGLLTPHRTAAQATSARTSDADTPFVDTRGQERWAFSQRILQSASWRVETERRALDRLARFPDSANTAVWLAYAGRLGDALDVLGRVIDRDPGRIAEVLEALETAAAVDLSRDQTQGYAARLVGLLASARATLPRLDRETAARLELTLLSFDRRQLSRAELASLQQELIDRYEGTLIARLASVGRVVMQRSVVAQLAEYDAIAQREGTSAVAARARFEKAFRLSSSSANLARETGNADPTDHWLEVLAIVRDLESGRYPAGRWIDDAIARVVSFSLYQAAISPANASRLLDALRQFVAEHQSLLDADDGDSIPYLVTSRMPEVAAFLPDGVAAMERLFAGFAREWDDPAAALYLKARWLDQVSDDRFRRLAVPPRSPTHEADVRALMATAAASARDSVYARRALVRLADREFADPASLDSAYAHFSEYLRRFATAPDAWLVKLRLGQVEQAQQRHQEAATRFAEVGRAHRDDPMVRALAFAYAARASEAAGRFEAALSFYRDSNLAWVPDLGETMALNLPAPPTPAPVALTLPTPNRGQVSRADVVRRLGELTRSLAVAGGAELERGRWLLRESRAREAVPVLERVARERARTPAGIEAGRILTRARLDAAIAMADPSNAAPNVATALAELERLGREPFDVSVGIAGVAGATLRMLQGVGADADLRLTGTLRRWVNEGSRTGLAPAPGTIEHDTLAVRDAVLLPLGGGLLRGAWNGFQFPAVLPPFLIAPADLQARVVPTGDQTTVDVSRQPPGLINVVFIPRDDVAYLSQVVSRLGGSARRAPAAIMQVPHQPVGDASSIIRWWNGFFPARPGHWGGFEVTTYPFFTAVAFTDAERTRAVVPVTIGYAGADVILDKVNGVWTITALANEWVT